MNILSFDSQQHRLSFQGKIIFDNALEILKDWAHILTQVERDVEIDCAAIEYTDSSFLGVLVEILRDLSLKNFNLVIYHFPPHLQGCLAIYGLEGLFVLIPQSEEILQSLT